MLVSDSHKVSSVAAFGATKVHVSFAQPARCPASHSTSGRALRRSFVRSFPPDKEVAGPSAKAVLPFSACVNSLNPWRQKRKNTPRIDVKQNAKYGL
jgi:hypothetical protein